MRAGRQGEDWEGRTMTVYAVFLNKADEPTWRTLAETWPGRHYILNEHMAFVAPEGITTTAEIAAALGIGKERDVLGIVFDWSAHSGFNRSDLWEWLGKVQA